VAAYVRPLLVSVWYSSAVQKNEEIYIQRLMYVYFICVKSDR